MKKIIIFLVMLSVLLASGCEATNDVGIQHETAAAQLNRPEGLKVKGDRLYWNSVSNCSGYYIRLEINGELFEKYTGMEVSASVSDLITESGKINFSVKAHGNGQNFLDSEWSDIFSFDYTHEEKETSSVAVSPKPMEQVIQPTTVPTAKPTAEPTVQPTAAPTVQPTAEPTVQPTAEPTKAPTSVPTQIVEQNMVESDGVFLDFYNNTGEKYGDDWWGASEVCGYVEKVKMNLSSGVLSVSAFIGDGELLDGEYGIEISLCKSRSPYDFISYTGEMFRVSNGAISIDDSAIKPMENGYRVSLNLQYSIDEPLAEYYLVTKVHSSVDSGNGPIVFYDFSILDRKFGLKAVDLRAKGIRVSAERLSTGEKVNCKLSKSGIWVPEIQDTIFDTDVDAENTNLGVVTSFFDKNDTVYKDHWWRESEVCAYVEHIKLPLSSGFATATAIVNDYQFEDGDYGLEIMLRGPYDVISYTATQFAITDGTISFHDQQYGYNRTEMGYEIDMMTCYACEDSLDEVFLVFKLHSSANNCDGNVIFKDIIFTDKTNGKQYLNLKSEGITASGERLYSHKEVETKILEINDTLTVTGIKQTIYTGETCKLTTEEKATFKSSNNIVADVDGTGQLTAVSPGKTRITVENEDGASYSWMMEVKNPYLEVKAKKTRILLADTYFYEAKPYGYKLDKVTWESSDETVGKIEANGKFTALKVGNTTITLKDSAGYSYSFDVEVFDVSDRDILQYIIMHDNEEVDVELEQKIYNHLIAVYKNVYSTFGDGTYHTVNVYFDHIDFAAAYATMDFSSSDHFEIHIGIETMANNINDVDCVTHELIHTAQNYPFETKTGENRVWLGEGLTDYGRYLLGVENEKAHWSLVEYQPGQHYTDSYRVTGSFIKYVVDVHDSSFAQKLNEAFRNREYTEELWIEATGYSIDELWEMYKRM